MTDVVGHPLLPPRPLLEMMLRAREGRCRYRPLVAGVPGAEFSPSEEVNNWLRQRAAIDPAVQRYLSEHVPRESHAYVLNRIVDMARGILYSTLEPWRTGVRWSQFERYAGRVVELACWTMVTLDEPPCDPHYKAG